MPMSDMSGGGFIVEGGRFLDRFTLFRCLWFEKERDEHAFFMHVCGGAVAIASLHSIFPEEHR
jgi:hypothetical protein